MKGKNRTNGATLTTEQDNYMRVVKKKEAPEKIF